MALNSNRDVNEQSSYRSALKIGAVAAGLGVGGLLYGDLKEAGSNYIENKNNAKAEMLANKNSIDVNGKAVRSGSFSTKKQPKLEYGLSEAKKYASNKYNKVKKGITTKINDKNEVKFVSALSELANRNIDSSELDNVIGKVIKKL